MEASFLRRIIISFFILWGNSCSYFYLTDLSSYRKIASKTKAQSCSQILQTFLSELNQANKKNAFSPGNDIPPVGELKAIARSFNKSEFPGSTRPQWYVDENGVEWLLKKDVKYRELQTSAEVISSGIYRHLGFSAPSIHIIYLNGQRYAAVKSLGRRLQASSLESNQSLEWKMIYFIGALIKDNDRIYGAKNNFDLGDGKFALFDFGGTLGSKAQGEHKRAWPGWFAYSDAIGTFENTREIEVIFGWFKNRYKPDHHAWNKVTRKDAQKAIKLLQKLTDEDIQRIVQKAKYTNFSDENYMIEALINRRDGLMEGLLNYFPSP